MTSLLFLDDYHVGDPLFLADLGRRLTKLGADGRTLVVHRVDDALTRELGDERPAQAPADADRIVRETNQSVARRLIEEGVSAMALQGSDRSLLTVEEDRIRADVSWLMAGVEMGSVPVISPLVSVNGGVALADAADCAVALAASIGQRDETQCILFCSTRKEGLFAAGERLPSVPIDALSEYADVVDTEAATALVTSTDRLLLTNSVALAKGTPIPGTVVTG